MFNLDNETKNELKKKSRKITFELIIKRILGIPHSLTGIYIKITAKILKVFKKKKSEKKEE